MPSGNSENLELNIAPIEFSKDEFILGTLPYSGHDDYKMLRDSHWRTHSFRYDNRTKLIYNIPIVLGQQPLGTPSKVLVKENLLPLARGVQQAILVWLQEKNTPILQSGKHLTFWGQNENALLLSKALKKYKQASRSDLEVAIKGLGNRKAGIIHQGNARVKKKITRRKLPRKNNLGARVCRV